VNRVSLSQSSDTKSCALAACLTVLALIVAAGGVARAQSAGAPANPSFAPQPDSSAPSANIQGQHEDDRTLEIAPQNGRAIPPDSGVQELPGDKEYSPNQDNASLDRNFNPDGQNSGDKHHKLPYLGVSVQYTLKCYLGQEEHGLEIINVDPNSPAWRSGLNGRKSMSAVGAAAVTATALLGPLELAVLPLLSRAGQLGTDGDLIVAVDDHRIRSQLDLEDELAKLKPGDTMYLTVIRPLPGGNHKTMKIAIKVGEPGQTVADAGSSGSGPSSSDAEEYAY
jgi:hypothetical protein